MSLDVYLNAIRNVEVYSANITHNCNCMAEEAGIYYHLWKPEEIGIIKAEQLIEPLKSGLELMEGDPERFIKLEADNGWGTYEQFISWIENYLKACEENPDAEVSVWR